MYLASTTPGDVGTLSSLSFTPHIQSVFGRGKYGPSTDDLLACFLIAMVISGGDSKRDTLAWYHATVQLAKTGMLHRLDADELSANSSSRRFEALEALEENRRLFWLLYSMDRHWSLSYNSMPLLHDQDCLVYSPLKDESWFSEDLTAMNLAEDRTYGPKLDITGFGFFQWFLPLMVILGDIVWTRHQQAHPRLNIGVDPQVVASTELMLEERMQELSEHEHEQRQSLDGHRQPTYLREHAAHSAHLHNGQAMQNDRLSITSRERTHAVARLYAKFIVHVLFVLLHGRWDALDLLQRNSSSQYTNGESSSSQLNPVRCPLSDWITSTHFTQCSSHAIAASDTLAEILQTDPELSLIPYLFGIYLLHGSFMLLFFADRMLEVGGTTNLSVRTACETVIRAHEISFTTLSVDFQRNFRKVLRATLEEVRLHQYEHVTSATRVTAPFWDSNSDSPYQAQDPAASNGSSLWREILGLYRWTSGFQGLAI